MVGKYVLPVDVWLEANTTVKVNFKFGQISSIVFEFVVSRTAFNKTIIHEGTSRLVTFSCMVS